MIPEPDQYLSFLMGALAISDEEINRLGVEIVERIGAGILDSSSPAPVFGRTRTSFERR